MPAFAGKASRWAVPSEFEFMKKLAILFFAMFLISCSPVSTPVVEQSIVVKTPTFTPTSLVVPTSTPEIIPTQVLEIKPSSTPVIIPTQYELPKWINDPKTTVAMVISDIEGSIYEFSFLNLETRDSFSIPMSPDIVRGYFWMPDGQHFGFLSTDSTIIFLVDIENGNVEQHPISKSTVRFLNDERIGTIEPLATNVMFGKDDFYLIPYFQSRDFSSNFKYRAKIDYEKDVVIVENLKTKDITEITDPVDGLYDYGYSWSPTVSYLEVLQGTEISGDMIPSGNKITIYKPNGEKVVSFEGDFTDPEWSFDGSKILYKETSSNSPCILEINTGEKKCIREIERDHPESSYISGFKWSLDAQQIYYIPHIESADTPNGKICIYNLVDGNDFCPKIEVSATERNNVEWYKVSPNGYFFVFSLGASCYGCDFWGEPSANVVSSDGKIFYSLGKEILVTEPYSFSYPMSSLLWRPNIALKP